MLSKDEILNSYYELCLSSKKALSRDQYRSLHPKFSSSLIEKMWGNWRNFVTECDSYGRSSIKEDNFIQDCVSQNKKVIVSTVFSGEEYDKKAFKLLKGMAKHMNADLRLLYVHTNKNKRFTEEQLEELDPYLVQNLTFTHDENAICKSINVRNSCKRPLTNIEKISDDYKLIVVSSSKQQCKILPYDTNETFKVAYSTGSISKFDYKNTITAYVDQKFNKCGAVVLEYNDTLKRYLPRNIEIVNDEIYDENLVFYIDNENVKYRKTTVDAMVLGDLHLPEEDFISVMTSVSQINAYKPKYVLIGDWCSFNSINHHESNKYLNKVMYYQQSLEDELEESTAKLNKFVDMTEDCEFLIIHSNHDEFLDKWLNSGEIEKDKQNAVTGMKLYLSYAEHKDPYFRYSLDKRIKFLKKGELFSINSVVLSNHGHVGLCGSKANSATYVKTYSKSITGHTHSPKIEDSNYTVGTCSKLNLTYTNHLSNWAFANALVHKNGVVQLIF